MTRFLRFTLILALTAAPCLAQTTADSTIRVHGSAKAESMVKQMRMRVEVYGVGADMNAALACLAKNRSLAQSKIDRFPFKPLLVRYFETKAVQEAPRNSEPTLTFVGPTPAAAPTPALAPTLGPTLAPTPALPPLEVGADALELPPPPPSILPETRISSLLELDVPLAGATEEDLLKSAEQWKALLKEADLSGIKGMEAERAKIQPKENEPALPCLCGLGETKFAFVQTLTEEDRISLAAKAITAAKQDAQRWAKITDLQIGRVVSLAVEKEIPAEVIAESGVRIISEVNVQVTFECKSKN